MVKMESEEMFEEKALVKAMKRPETETTTRGRSTKYIPSNFALTPSNFLLPCPEEGSTATLNFLDRANREQQGGHDIDWKGVEDCMYYDGLPYHRKQETPPSSKAAVNFVSDKEERGQIELMC